MEEGWNFVYIFVEKEELHENYGCCIIEWWHLSTILYYCIIHAAHLLSACYLPVTGTILNYIFDIII